MSRILGIDPGEKNIGIAISDPTATIATPLKVLKHINRHTDAQNISEIAAENDVAIIVVGQALTIEGLPSYSGRKAARLAAAIRKQTQIPVILWDEANSTKIAQVTKLVAGVPLKKRRGHHDDIAAVIILQSFLNTPGNLTNKNPPV